MEELQAKLTWTQGELEAQREAERQRQLQVGMERTPGDSAGCEQTTQETQNAHVSHRADSLAVFLELGVRARMTSS